MNESNDPELENLLRRYRPGDPPAGLRERILIRGVSQPVWPWAAAAAVLLVSALTLRMAAQREAGGLDLELPPDPAIAAVNDLTEMLGGGAGARELAELMVPTVRPIEPEGERP